jgi:hypothetical protein
MPVKRGQIINPTGKGGFGDNPENRNAGYWSSKDSISFQYKRFLRMSIKDLKTWLVDTPDSERTVAMDIAYSRVVASKRSLADAKEVTDRTEGKALQTVDMSMDTTLKSTRQKIGDFLDETDDPSDSETAEREYN